MGYLTLQPGFLSRYREGADAAQLLSYDDRCPVLTRGSLLVRLMVKTIVVLGLVCTLLVGIALSRPAPASNSSAHSLLTCGGEEYLPPCW